MVRIGIVGGPMNEILESHLGIEGVSKLWTIRGLDLVAPTFQFMR